MPSRSQNPGYTEDVGSDSGLLFSCLALVCCGGP